MDRDNLAELALRVHKFALSMALGNQTVEKQTVIRERNRRGKRMRGEAAIAGRNQDRRKNESAIPSPQKKGRKRPEIRKTRES
jgi:predicted transposase YdaD